MKNSLDNLFANYNQALALYKLGFEEPCFGRIYADNSIERLSYEFKNCDIINRDRVTVYAAPLRTQVFAFFRDKYQWSHSINGEHSDDGFSYNCTLYCRLDGTSAQLSYEGEDYDKAEAACIDKLIELVKNKMD